jgi:hypothetical protein
VLRLSRRRAAFGSGGKGSVPMAKLQNGLVGYRAECGETTALSETLALGSGIFLSMRLSTRSIARRLRRK